MPSTTEIEKCYKRLMAWWDKRPLSIQPDKFPSKENFLHAYVLCSGMVFALTNVGWYFTLILSAFSSQFSVTKTNSPTKSRTWITHNPSLLPRRERFNDCLSCKNYAMAGLTPSPSFSIRSTWQVSAAYQKFHKHSLTCWMRRLANNTEACWYHSVLSPHLPTTTTMHNRCFDS